MKSSSRLAALALIVAGPAFAAPPSMSPAEMTAALQRIEVSLAKQQASIAANVPPGTVIAFAGTIDATHKAPAGWLVCDGHEYQKADYPQLAAALGNTYGSASGANGFRVPDYRGYFLRGQDQGAGRDPDAAKRRTASGATGDLVGSLETGATSLAGITVVAADAMGGNQFAVQVTNSCDTVHEKTDCDGWDHEPNLHWVGGRGNHAHGLSGGGSESRPSNMSVVYLIKAG